MHKGYMQIIYGPGKGKTAMALGKGLSAVANGRTAVMIQFLQGSLHAEQMAVYNRLEPELQVFRCFEKSAESFSRLSEEAKNRIIYEYSKWTELCKKSDGNRRVRCADLWMGCWALWIRKSFLWKRFKKLLSVREETVNSKFSPGPYFRKS